MECARKGTLQKTLIEKGYLTEDEEAVPTSYGHLIHT